MSQAIQNRFTKTAFDAAQSVYIGEGKLLTARYSCKGRTWKATIQWKPGYEKDFTSLTTLDEAAMKSALLRLDSTVRFLGQVNTAPAAPVQTLTDKTSEMLEALRTDPQTSDRAYISACQLYRQKPKPRNAPAEVRTQNGGPDLPFEDAKALEAMRADTVNVSALAYRNACAKLGVPPRPRPTQAATAAAQWLVPFHVQGQAYGEFMQAHGELFVGIFAERNAAIIAQWLQDENRQVDAASLEQCYRELKAFGCFRTAATLTRDMNGSLAVVQPYSHERIVAMRHRQVVEAATAPPAHLSDVDKEAWLAVRESHPRVAVGSSKFRELCGQQVLAWAKEYVLEANPTFATANKRSDLRSSVDRVLLAWCRQQNANLGQGQKTIRDTRIWLGSIFL